MVGTYLSQVRAMIDAGYFHELADVAAIPSYWNHFLQDYPDHPIINSEHRDSTLGLTLYCTLPEYCLQP